MVKYDYDVENECFSRVDGRGKSYKINIYEGKRIESLRGIGYSVQKIYDKMTFNNEVTITNLRSFIRNLEEGNISVDGDYPAPVQNFEKLDTEARITELERKVESLQSNKESKTDKSILGRVKAWMQNTMN